MRNLLIYKFSLENLFDRLPAAFYQRKLKCKKYFGLKNLLRPVTLSITGRKGASAQSPEGREGCDNGRGGQAVGPQEAAGSGGGEEP